MSDKNGLSLIVPIYNVENYIEECLGSVVKSMKDRKGIQVILVDDGSQDGSGIIARKYADNHSNFHYFWKENGGLADARNFGLKQVQFDYVAFLDSDDWLHESYFTKVFAAMESQPDLIVFDWMDVVSGEKRQVVRGIDFDDIKWSVSPSACNKVFKTAIFNGIEFPEGRVYEDVGTIYKLLYYVDNHIYINEPLYIYRKNREGSIMTTVSVNINDIYIALEDTYEFYSARGAVTGENQKGLCYQYVKLLCWSNMYRQLQFYKYDIIGFYLKMRETRLLVYNRFGDWKENEYLSRNAAFFEERLGKGYIKILDDIGKTFLSTTSALVVLVAKNRKRVA